jgi:3',5'-cyclic-AMP phosphodiesterase
MLIAQITDTHISTPGSVNDAQLLTAEHLERAVAHLNGLTRKPDVVIATGDLVERGEPEEYVRFRAIVDRLTMPLYVIPGNHDAREALASAFADGGYLPNGDAFLHYTVDKWPVRLIGLDTQIPGQPGGRLCEERLRWLDARLSEVPAQPTVVFMHHPPFVTGLQAMDVMGLDGKEELAEIVRRHPQVERLLCGHVHRPVTRRFGGTVASTCPSTAHQIALGLIPARSLAIVMEPPACALHLWLESGLVSHLSVIGHPTPSLTVFDGDHWLPKAAPPPNFHPR